MTEQHEVDPGDRFASARRFPRTLPAPSTGGGAELGELGELGQLYRPAGSWPAPADAPAAAPPIVASGPGSRVGWLMHTDYRRPLDTFKETISAVVALQFYLAGE